MKKTKKLKAFTIIELIVVISIIGILATITVVSYSGWKQNIAVVQLKNDLTGAVSAMEGYKTFNDVYPTFIPTTFQTSEGISIKGGDDGNGGYCLEATSTNSQLTYHISKTETGENELAVGNCYVKFATVTTGGSVCALSYNHKAYCWGYNSFGQIGDNSTTNRLVPTLVSQGEIPVGETFLQVSSGSNHVCAVASNHKAYCWGNNANGQLGINSIIQSQFPAAVNNSGVLGGKTIISVVAGTSYSCALDSNGKVYCWGANNNRQLGDGTSTQSLVPVAVYMGGALGGKTVTSIITKTDTDHTCAKTTDLKFYCWGANSFGELGDGTSAARYAPVEVKTDGALAGKTILSISPGSYHTCVVASDNKAYCWGKNASGELGNGLTADSKLPVAANAGILSGKDIAVVSAGYLNSCAIDSSGKAYCWSNWGACGAGNSCGRLGDGTYTASINPVAVSFSGALNGKRLLSIIPGTYTTCSLASDGRSYCWGYGLGGLLGDGLGVGNPSPTASASMLLY